MYASYLRQTYFDMPIHVFRFCILTKLVFGFIVKNIDIYLYMYIGVYPYTICWSRYDANCWTCSVGTYGSKIRSQHKFQTIWTIFVL